MRSSSFFVDKDAGRFLGLVASPLLAIISLTIATSFSTAASIFSGGICELLELFDTGLGLSTFKDEISSPSSSRIAIGALTDTPSVPEGTSIFPNTPSSTASTSMVALSVSISARTSPDTTLSPSFLSHATKLPSVIVGDKAGISI